MISVVVCTRDRAERLQRALPSRTSATFDVRFGSGAKIPSAQDWDFLYRARTASAKIVFSPEVLVFHDHGRRSDAEVEALRRGYAIGRWAFYCKHAARLDRHVAWLRALRRGETSIP